MIPTGLRAILRSVRAGGSGRLLHQGLVALVALVAACSAQPTGAPTPTASPPTSAPVSPSPTGSSPSVPFAPAADCEDATIEGAVVTIRQVDNLFMPECLVVLGGQSLRIRNQGENVHNFTIEGTQVDLDLQPGTRVKTEPVAEVVAPGTYTFFCRFHRRFGMEGEITVTAVG